MRVDMMDEVEERRELRETLAETVLELRRQAERAVTLKREPVCAMAGGEPVSETYHND